VIEREKYLGVIQQFKFKLVAEMYRIIQLTSEVSQL